MRIRRPLPRHLAIVPSVLHVLHLLIPLLLLATAPTASADLGVHPGNPRWLTDDGGRTALVLSGAHAWSLFQDYDFSPAFDADSYLKTLGASGHNFTRGWFWEDAYYSPLPYTRADGLYRLTPPHNTAFVKRVRKRVGEAWRRDLYVSIMLFQGWSMDNQGGRRAPDPWPLNPYNRANTNEAVSKQQAALHIGRAQGQQLDYVTHLAEKLCSEPNIIWEIANEAHAESLGNETASNWQRNILEHLVSKCDRHLTWVSCPAVIGLDTNRRRELNEAMYAMTSDLVAPCKVDSSAVSDPAPADGRKVLIADSDHYGPEDISYEWVWKTFLRGQHPLFMDVTQTLDWWAG
ncbi:MAG: hypothetical protein OES47_11490, partial [Acidobacteriota bacterium]|nr:hypothetical protein [Acidobacteriota bacterium]